MKYLKRYNEVYKKSAISEDDIKLYDYIIGTGVLNESTFVGVVDRLKTLGKKGLITAALLSSLFSNPAFSREYDALPDSEKREIQSMVKDDGENNRLLPSKPAPYSKTNFGFTADFGDFFESGKHTINASERGKMDIEIQKIKDFMAANKDESLVISIIASESRVPFIVDGKQQPEKELAQKRFDWIKQILQQELGDRVSIVGNSIVGGPAYKGDGPDQNKYKEHQYVKATVGLDLWKLNRKENGLQALREDAYIGKSFQFPVSGREGSGTIKLSPGRIPDRAKVFVDGVLVADSGYFSETPSEKGYKLTPSYVLEMSRELIKSPKMEAFKGARTKKVKSVEELNELILEKDFDPSKSGLNRGEYEYGYKLLKQFAEMQIKSKGYATIVTYSYAPQPMNIYVSGRDNTVSIEVYSPVGNTGFGISASMKNSKSSNLLAMP